MSSADGGKLPEYLSPSSVGTYRQCPLKYKLSRIDKIAEPPTQETLMGNFVHEVLEKLYALPLAERTQDAAGCSEEALKSRTGLISEIWYSDGWGEKVMPFLRNVTISEFKWNCVWCVRNAFTIENPQSFTPNGIESELNGKIGGVQMRGFIDRWLIDGETIIISDYKTGKTPSPRYMGDKFFQLTIYSLLLGQVVTDKSFKLELLYLKDAVKKTHVPTEHDFTETEVTITTVKKEIDTSYESGNWEAIPSRLCDWCSYKRTVCTYWNKKNER